MKIPDLGVFAGLTLSVGPCVRAFGIAGVGWGRHGCRPVRLNRNSCSCGLRSSPDDGTTAVPLWLGVDLSTQSITAAVLRGNGNGPRSADPVALESVNFERDLPAEQRYGAVNGMKVDGPRVTSPVMMWLHALDALLVRLADKKGALAAAGHSLADVVSVSVSGQQHGTVYWRRGARESLARLTWTCTGERGGERDGGGHMPGLGGLADTLQGCFAIEHTPIWADGSTETQARELEEAMGGAQRLAEVTGSRAHLRQGAPQITKIFREDPLAYQDTERISLVCSFLPSVLVARYCPVDTSDGSGMNLMHIRDKKWYKPALEATAPGLLERLGGDESIVDSHVAVGNICRYFCERYGFSSDCLVVAGSGDNCNSLAGMGVTDVKGGVVLVSLGTSDTLLGLTSSPNPTTTGNTMYHPCDPEAWFVMLVYKNGDLTRKRVRDTRAGGSWDEFSRLLRETPPGNGGRLGLFLDLYEITPQINCRGDFRVDERGSPLGEDDFTAGQEVRAAVEGRFLSMRSHARELGIGTINKIVATGGGSNNLEVLGVLSDIFQAPVYTAAVADSAAVGAALRAKHGHACQTQGSPKLAGDNNIRDSDSAVGPEGTGGHRPAPSPAGARAGWVSFSEIQPQGGPGGVLVNLEDSGASGVDCGGHHAAGDAGAGGIASGARVTPMAAAAAEYERLRMVERYDALERSVIAGAGAGAGAKPVDPRARVEDSRMCN